MKQSVIFLLPSLCSYISSNPSLVCRTSAAIRLWVCQWKRLILISPSFLGSLKYPLRSLISLQILRSGVTLIDTGCLIQSERSSASIILKMWAGKSILISYFLSLFQPSSRRIRGPIGYCEIIREIGIFICSFDGRLSCQNYYPSILFSLALINLPFIFVKVPSVQFVIWIRMDILLGEQKFVMTPTSIPLALYSSSLSLKHDRLNLILNSLANLQQQGYPSIPSPSQSKILSLFAVFREISKGLDCSRGNGGAELTISFDVYSFSIFSRQSSFYFLRLSAFLMADWSQCRICNISMFCWSYL